MDEGVWEGTRYFFRGPFWAFKGPVPCPSLTVPHKCIIPTMAVARTKFCDQVVEWKCTGPLVR